MSYINIVLALIWDLSIEKYLFCYKYNMIYLCYNKLTSNIVSSPKFFSRISKNILRMVSVNKVNRHLIKNPLWNCTPIHKNSALRNASENHKWCKKFRKFDQLHDRECVVAENVHAPPTEVIGNSWAWEWGVSKAKNFEV